MVEEERVVITAAPSSDGQYIVIEPPKQTLEQLEEIRSISVVIYRLSHRLKKISTAGLVEDVSRLRVPEAFVQESITEVLDIMILEDPSIVGIKRPRYGTLHITPRENPNYTIGYIDERLFKLYSSASEYIDDGAALERTGVGGIEPAARSSNVATYIDLLMRIPPREASRIALINSLDLEYAGRGTYTLYVELHMYRKLTLTRMELIVGPLTVAIYKFYRFPRQEQEHLLEYMQLLKYALEFLFSRLDRVKRILTAQLLLLATEVA